MLDEGPRRTSPLGHGCPLHIYENGPGFLLPLSSSHGLSILHHCDLSVFKAEQDLFDFTAGWFSNLATHLENRKEVLYKNQPIVTVRLFGDTSCNSLLPIKRVLLLNVKLYFTFSVKIMWFCCPHIQTWDILKVLKYYILWEEIYYCYTVIM